jgi:hypothetical protein
MYGIRLDDIRMNGKSLGLCGPQGKQKDCIITVASGTTFASVPSWAYSEISGNWIKEWTANPRKTLDGYHGLLTVKNILWKRMNGCTHQHSIQEQHQY